MDKFFRKLTEICNEIHEIAEYRGSHVNEKLRSFLLSCAGGDKTKLPEILIESDHALNLVLKINRSSYDHKHFHELDKLDKKLKSSIKHLKEHPEIRETKSLDSIIGICLEDYNNKTIEIKNGIDYKLLSETFLSYNISSVASYKHWLFDPKYEELLKKHHLYWGERMVVYAEHGKNGERLLKDVSELLGIVVAERKKYESYAYRTYAINCERGLHTRPSQYLVELCKKSKGDVWLRTPSREIDGKNIMGVMGLGLKKGKNVTISYRPKEDADEFFSSLERLKDYTGEFIFSNHKKIPVVYHTLKLQKSFVDF